MSKAPSRIRILAAASGGGHWIQLRRLEPAFEGAAVSWLTTRKLMGDDVQGPMHLVADANSKTPLRMVWMFLQVVWLILRVRPHVVVTTGAAPGCAAIVFGRLTGARTVWIDSIANSEKMSRSGRWVRWFAVVWLTQWEHLVGPRGPEFWGTVL